LQLTANKEKILEMFCNTKRSFFVVGFFHSSKILFGRQFNTLGSSGLRSPWGVFGSFFEPRQIQFQVSN